MTTFNPTSLFYFTTCLRLDDSEAELHHSILETLTRENNSDQEVLIAIKNIILCDAPFQIYSFPYVISQLSKLDKYHPIVKATLKEYSQLFISLFGEQNEIIAYLFNELIDISKGENLADKLIQLSDSAHSSHNDVSDYEITLPYIDIVEFGSEAITMNLLNHFCGNQDVSNNLINHLEENPNSSLNLLMENSYSHKRGRVCFLLSVELKRQLQLLDSKEDFSKNIWKNNSVSTSPDLEPDLVFLFLEYWFLFFDKRNSEEEKIKNILTELGNFNLYAKHLISINGTTRREEFAHKNFVKYLRILFGKDVNHNSILFEKSSLSINIWIGSIYLLISEYFEIALSESALLKLWGPINFNDNGIAFNSRFEMISERLASLINAKSGGDPKRKKNQKNNLKILSPWLTLDTSEKSFKNYIEVESYSNWLRSLYAVKASINILIKSESDKANLFGYYLIHVSELLSFCKDLLNNTQLNENNKLGFRVNETLRRKPQLLKLLLALNRDVNKLIGGNNLSKISNEYFYSLLEKENSRSEWLSNFQTDVIPNVLYNWVYYYSLQTSLFNPDITSQNKNFKILESKTKTRSKVRLKVLRKLLHNDEIGRVDNLDNNLDRILLLNPVSISEIKFRNPNAVIDNHISFAIAIQKFHFVIRSGFAPIDEYRNDLLEILKSIRTTPDFSYPNRFAIASLFNEFEKINDDNDGVFELSIEVLFELNGLFDISLLSNRVIQKLISFENYNFNQAQITVLNCLSNSVSIALKYNIHERNNTDKPADPLQNILQNQKIEFLRHTLNSIQFVVCKFKKQFGNKVRVHNYYHSNERNYKIIDTEVSVKNNIPHFNLPQEYDGSPTEELSLITYNSIEQTAQFYVHDIQIPKGTLNLFELNKEEIEELFSNHSEQFFFVARCLGNTKKGTQLQYKFQICFDRDRDDYQSLKSFEIETGELVQLKYFYSRNINDWVIDNNYCEKIEDIAEDKSLITINNIGEVRKYNLPLNYWLPSHSDIFTGYLQSELNTNGASILIGEKRKPIFYFFNTLLLSVKNINDKIVLTFIGKEWDVDRQEYGYLFYQTFGLYFLLFEDEISFPESENYNFTDFIQSEIGYEESDISSLNGLIVSFELSFKNSNVKLALVFKEPKDTIESDKRFPFLQTPFDDRNIRWRTMFDESEDVEFTARNVRGDWICAISDEWNRLGFNETIFVTLDKNPQHQNEIDFLLEKGWTNDGGRFKHSISGKIIERSSIKISQLQNYLGLKENQKVQIKTALQVSKKSATIPCFSKDNYRVSINMEELTFLPVNREGQNFDKAFQYGNFFISNITKWRELKIELAINNFPLEKLKGISEIVGYFINVPRRKEQGVGSCSVVLEISEDNLGEEIEIEIENISDEEIQRGLALYSRLEGKLLNNKWHFYLLTRQIFLKSSRKLKEIQDTNFNEYYFLGKANLNGEPKYLFEKEDELGVLFYANQYADSIQRNDLYDSRNQINSNWLSQVLGNNVPRIGFVNHDRIITGSINGRNNLQINQIASLQNISFRFEHLENDEYFVRRNFTIGIREQQQKNESRHEKPKQKEQENAKRLKYFVDYFIEPYELFGRIEKEQFKVVITSSNGELNSIPEENIWTNKVSLFRNEKETLEDLVFVPSAASNYKWNEANAVAIWLVKDANDKVSATFKYGQLTIDDLFEKFDFKLDEIIDVSSNKIYFADKEKIHPFTNTEHEQEMYRFEEGFGKNILIPSDQLLWNGNPIKTGDLAFFHSDAIKKFNFVKSSVAGKDIIKLNIVFIEISQAHRLYLQARTHNIYHLAHIGCNTRGVYIKHVKGVDENSIRDDNMTTIYDRINATFDDASKRTLRTRFDSDNENLEKVVLVKIDTTLFKRTGKLQFNHYRLTYISDPDYPETKILDRKAKVIMVLGNIWRFTNGNDYCLRISPNPSLDKIDIGQDFSEGILVRRELSLNEGLLREYYRRKDTNYFNGFEVYLTVEPFGRNRVSYSLKSNGVFRNQSVLFKDKGKSVVGIAIDKFRTTQDLIIEVKPGNFLKLQNSKLIFKEIKSINEGDVLSISINHDETFTIESAFAGDYRFIEHNRKVVVLPKDSVFNNPNQLPRFNSTPYTVGGLPNVELDFQNIDINRRNNFLLEHHPKIACINKNTYNDKEQIFLKLKFDEGTSIHGHILIDEANKELKFVSKEDGKEKQFPIKWNSVSFYDESAGDLIQRIKKCRWQYHDEQSRNLTKGVNGFQSGEPYELLPSTIHETGSKNFISGPIFCEREGDRINLRFAFRLSFWSYPVSSLIDFLDYIKGAYTFSYAGKQDNIHFIEIAPGRIVELPINLLVLKISSIEIPMKNYAWNFLNVGDEITLKNITDDLSDLFKIELISIKHGLRNVLNKFSKLPIHKVEKEKGFIELGSGKCILRLPISSTILKYDSNKPIEFLNETNQFTLQHDNIFLGNENTALLSLTTENYFTFLGFSDYKPDYVEYLSRDKIKDLVKACDGTIPVTVVKQEGINFRQFKLPSLKVQEGILDGKTISGFIVNALNEDYEELIVKIGGYFEIISYEKIISGVPKKQRKFVTQALIREQVWLQVNFDKQKTSYSVISGLSQDLSGTEIFVSKVNHVTDTEGNFIGTICRANISQQYYWMPEREMAWCNIKSEIADCVFYNVSNNGLKQISVSIKVRICNGKSGDFISRIKTTELNNSFRKKRCGSDNIDVLTITTPIKSSDSKLSFVGYSLLHKVLVYCVLFDEPNTRIPQLHETVKTEVIEKDAMGLKLKTLFGDKKILLHIPIYTTVSFGLKESETAKELNENINRFRDCNNTDLINNAGVIKKAHTSILSEKGNNAASLKSGFIVLERLCKLQNIDNSYNYISRIEDLLELLKLNLLRHICIETLNRNEPQKQQDHYLDLILNDSLKPFYTSQEVFVTEKELDRLRKTALTLCFQSQDLKYPLIGNSILQALGLKSHLDLKTMSNSTLYAKIYKPLCLYSSNEAKTIENEFLNLLRRIIKIIETNQIQINLLQERLI